MQDKNHDVEYLWSRETFCHWTGRRWLIDRTEEIPRIIVRLDRLVEDIASSKGDQFTVVKGRRGGLVVLSSPLAKRMMDCARVLDIDLVRQCLPRHRFSPNFELWACQREAIRELALGTPPPSVVASANAWMAGLRTEARSPLFRDVLRRQERAARKNAKSTREYLHKLFRRYPSLLVVRVDLGYRNDLLDVGSSWVPPPDLQVKKNLAEQLRFIQRKLDALAGYLWKIEHGAAKGHHCQLLVLLDGNKAREGITWGTTISNSWLEITGGLGSCWNWNADEEYFQCRGLLGIGLINHDDKLGRKNLMRTAMYLAKSDYYARYVSPEIARTFGKGVLKEEPGERGRPRKHSGASEPVRDEDVAPTDLASLVTDMIRRGRLPANPTSQSNYAGGQSASTKSLASVGSSA